MPKRARGGDGAAKPAKKRKKMTVRGGRSSAKLAPETKYFDTTFSATVDSAANWGTANVACTSYIQSDGTTVGAYTDSALIPSATGSGYGQVVGSKYLLKALRVRGMLKTAPSVDQADVSVPVVVRLVLVLDTQPNGAQALASSVFTDLGSADQCNFSYLAMAGGSGGRFQILKDRWYVLQPAVAGTDGTNTNSTNNEGTLFSLEYSPKKPLSCRIKNDASTPAIAALSDNNVYLIAHAGGAAPAVTIIGAARAYYVD